MTTGAIYTRYKNKDELFCSLLQDFLGKMGSYFSPSEAEYEKARQLGTTEALLSAIDFEEHIYIKLLTEHYDECTLFFSRSDGSSVEAMLNELMRYKIEQTVKFFSEVYGKAPNAEVLKLLMGSQFWYFRQLLDDHLAEDEMFSSLHSLVGFFNAGWRQLCETLN